MSIVQDNFLQDRLEAFLASQDLGGTPSDPGSGELSQEAIDFLGNPSSLALLNFILDGTGTNKVVFSDDPVLKFGTAAGRVLITTTSGVVVTEVAESAANANSLVRRNASGGFSFSGGIASTAASTTLSFSGAGSSVALTGANSSISVNGTIGLSNGALTITNGSISLTGTNSAITTAGTITGQTVLSNTHLGINSSGFVARIVAPVLTSNIDITLPATTGNLLLGSTNAVNFLSNPTSANLRTLVLDDTGEAGGVLVFSNRPNLNGFTMPELNLGTIGPTNAGDLNQLSTSHRIRATLSAGTTFSMPPASSTNSSSFEVLLYNGIGNNVTPFFTGVKFPSGASLTITSGRFNLYKFISFNGQWYGIVEGAGYI
jgi:hypothetical protein